MSCWKPKLKVRLIKAQFSENQSKGACFPFGFCVLSLTDQTSKKTQTLIQVLLHHTMSFWCPLRVKLLWSLSLSPVYPPVRAYFQIHENTNTEIAQVWASGMTAGVDGGRSRRWQQLDQNQLVQVLIADSGLGCDFTTSSVDSDKTAPTISPPHQLFWTTWFPKPYFSEKLHGFLATAVSYINNALLHLVLVYRFQISCCIKAF